MASPSPEMNSRWPPYFASDTSSSWLIVDSTGTVWTGGPGTPSDTEATDPGYAITLVPVAEGMKLCRPGDLGNVLCLKEGGAYCLGPENPLASPFDAPPASGSMRQCLKGSFTDVWSLYGFSYALRTDGSVWTWGWKPLGRSVPESVWDDFKSALKRERSLPQSHFDAILQPGQVTSLEGIRQIACGRGFALALRKDGALFYWGKMPKAAPSVELPRQIMTGVRAISAGSEHVVALKEDQTLWGWGDNGCGQIGDKRGLGDYVPEPVRILDSVTLAVTASPGVVPQFTLALRADGSLWGWGEESHILALAEDERIGGAAYSNFLYDEPLLPPVRLHGDFSLIPLTTSIFYHPKEESFWMLVDTLFPEERSSREIALKKVLEKDNGVYRAVEDALQRRFEERRPGNEDAP